VVIAARRLKELERVKSECKDPSKVICVELDMGDPKKILEFGENYKLTQRIDILVNNAGVA